MSERSFERALNFLGVAALAMACGMVALSLLGRPIPDSLTVCLGNVVGGLIGITAQPSKNRPRSDPTTPGAGKSGAPDLRPPGGSVGP